MRLANLAPACNDPIAEDAGDRCALCPTPPHRANFWRVRFRKTSISINLCSIGESNGLPTAREPQGPPIFTNGASPSIQFRGPMRSMDHIGSRLAAVWRWLGEAQIFWLTWAVCLVALWYSFRAGATECDLRYSGLALQCLGIGTVAWGIRNTRLLFDEPGLVASARAWVHRAPFRTRAAAQVRVPGIPRDEAFGTPEIRVPAAAMSADERISKLERLHEELNMQFNEWITRIDSRLASQTAALAGR